MRTFFPTPILLLYNENMQRHIYIYQHVWYLVNGIIMHAGMVDEVQLSTCYYINFKSTITILNLNNRYMRFSMHCFSANLQCVYLSLEPQGPEHCVTCRNFILEIPLENSTSRRICIANCPLEVPFTGTCTPAPGEESKNMYLPPHHFQ